MQSTLNDSNDESLQLSCRRHLSFYLYFSTRKIKATKRNETIVGVTAEDIGNDVIRSFCMRCLWNLRVRLFLYQKETKTIKEFFFFSFVSFEKKTETQDSNDSFFTIHDFILFCILFIAAFCIFFSSFWF